MIYCNHCRGELPDDSQFCSFCGNRIIKVTYATDSSDIIPVPIADVNILLKRAFLFIEDGLFDRADQYLENVLDQDPENAQAYLGKLMIDLRVNTQEQLANQNTPFNENGNYIKALRFGDEQLVSALTHYHQIVSHGAEGKEEQYSRAIHLIRNAGSAQDYYRALSILNQIGNYKDSTELRNTCIEECERIYQFALKKFESSKIEDLDYAIYLFESLSDFHDADQLLEKVKSKKQNLSEVKAAEEKDFWTGMILLIPILVLLFIAIATIAFK